MLSIFGLAQWLLAILFPTIFANAVATQDTLELRLDEPKPIAYRCEMTLTGYASLRVRGIFGFGGDFERVTVTPKDLKFDPGIANDDLSRPLTLEFDDRFRPKPTRPGLLTQDLMAALGKRKVQLERGKALKISVKQDGSLFEGTATYLGLIGKQARLEIKARTRYGRQNGEATYRLGFGIDSKRLEEAHLEQSSGQGAMTWNLRIETGTKQ